jgi:hypothetical protein
MNKKPYPIYDSNGKFDKVKPGLYLGLFHGFKSEAERIKVDDWGADGPMIGPLEYVHTTYACHIKIKFVDSKDAKKYGIKVNSQDMGIIDGCVHFNGMQYGDWTVFNVKE